MVPARTCLATAVAALCASRSCPTVQPCPSTSSSDDALTVPPPLFLPCAYVQMVSRPPLMTVFILSMSDVHQTLPHGDQHHSLAALGTDAVGRQPFIPFMPLGSYHYIHEITSLPSLPCHHVHVGADASSVRPQVRLLVELGGASPSVLDRWTSTPLMEARRVQAQPVIQFLLPLTPDQVPAPAIVPRPAAAHKSARFKADIRIVPAHGSAWYLSYQIPRWSSVNRVVSTN